MARTKMARTKKEFTLNIGYNENEHELTGSDVLKIISQGLNGKEVWGKGFFDNVTVKVGETLSPEQMRERADRMKKEADLMLEKAEEALRRAEEAA